MSPSGDHASGDASLARRIRHLIPRRLQPAARYHYERWRGLAEREMQVVCDAVRPGDRVADIGASYGVYTYALARRGALVEAFEPQPECVEILRAYAAAVPAVRVHPVGLGATAGAARLISLGADRGPEARLRAAPPDGLAGTGGAGAVSVAALDDIAAGPWSLLKIDVEGGEGDVLRGARRTIERDRPLIFVEVEQRHLSVPIADAFRFIESLGYDIDFLGADGRPRPLKDFDVERDQDVSALEGGSGVYINNFFLTHRQGARRWFG